MKISTNTSHTALEQIHLLIFIHWRPIRIKHCLNQWSNASREHIEAVACIGYFSEFLIFSPELLSSIQVFQCIIKH